ncbi:MFS transporter [Ktedonosporobacter rubrisoli]|uniref:MFS transporter n=1 Tax=Ktedonosporobacter rubrisoli TaxID=2509675 RepID=A0A4P6JRV1_KTERU|nr:MFS transporter [Ktedonosporobacter rubrisoli]QBD78094.1 MFS transporter [Ktedonosporobacter rubrisoli]
MRTQPNASDKKLDEPGSKPSRRWQISWLNRDLTLLFSGRGLRSLAQSYLAIIVPLYLARLGFDAIHLGILFTASAIASALLAASVGMLSDRFGRKLLLILISLLMTFGGIFFALSGNFIVLVIAGALGTIGRGGGAGSGGAWGPYYPAEQALIAEHVNDVQRTHVFGALSFVGVIAGALGSLLAVIPGLLQTYLSTSLLTGYRILFLLTAVIGVAMALVVVPVREQRHIATREKALSTDARPLTTHSASRTNFMGVTRSSWNLLWRFMVTNTTNGLAIGVLGSFMTYWFFRRYGVDAAQLGALFFIINIAAAIPYLLAGNLARRLGAVRTIVITRTISVILLAFIAFMPTFFLAATLYLIRMIANTLSNPVRQSYLMGIIPRQERASAAGLANFPSQVAAAISPSFAGYLMQQVALDLPLEFAAIMQALNVILYYWFFRNIHPPEESQQRK